MVQTARLTHTANSQVCEWNKSCKWKAGRGLGCGQPTAWYHTQTTCIL